MGKKLTPHLLSQWLGFCWHMRIKRWDLEAEAMPGWVWNVWREWMAENPDSPAHHDQMAINLRCLELERSAGHEDLEDRLMARRLFPPWRPKSE